MWSPTHVQLTVQRARGLIAKGKHGTNDAFVTIALGKEKFQTSVKEKAKSIDTIEWHEKCELQIPKQGNKAEIILTVLHHNFLGVDEFLGCVYIPLYELDVYERPKNRWFQLKDKPGKDKNKERGELEVKISFIVKSGSLLDLSKKEKHKSSLGQLSQNFGGSLISIRSLDKRKGLKKLVNNIGSKIGRGKKVDELPVDEDFPSGLNKQDRHDADPGVISDDDDFALDELSHKGSGSSLNWTNPGSQNSERSSDERVPSSQTTPIPSKPPRINPPSPAIVPVSPSPPSPTRSPVPTPRSPVISTPVPKIQVEPPKKPALTKKLFGSKSSSIGSSMERIIVGKEVTRETVVDPGIPNEVVNRYIDKPKEELIKVIVDLKSQVESFQKQNRDLEEYIDNLLLRVMETSPRILQNPYINCKPHAHLLQ